MAEDRELSLAELELDLENYRLGTQETVRDVIKAMAEEQGAKLGRLGKDILDRGLSPIKRLMVTPLDDDPSRFRVLEGNRRVTAMKLIQNPALAEGTVLHTTFKRLNKRRAELPKKLKCTSLSPEEGFIWREREHSIGQNGLGTEQWSATARLRAAADQGKKAHAHEVLAMALNNDSLSDAARAKIESRKFKVTNLSRLLESNEVRNELGLDASGARLQASLSKPWVISVLTKAVEIIATEKNLNGKPFTVKNIYDAKDQRSFIKSVAKTVNIVRESVAPWTIDANVIDVQAKAIPKKKARKPNARTQDRSTIVPPDSIVHPAAGRANDLYIELRSLNLDLYPNAAAILFRVFIEFSVDQLIKRKPVGIGINKELKNKIQASSQYLLSTSLLTRKELLVVDNMVGTLGDLVSTITLNGYVHNDKAFPSAEELKVSWSRIEHFLAKLWSC